MNLRWVAIILQFICVLVVYALDLVDRQQFVLSILILLPVYIVNQYLSNSVYKKKFASAQLYCDLFVIAALLYVNGGVKNPFTFILVLNVILAPFFLSKISSIVFLLSAAIIMVIMNYSPFNFAVDANLNLYSSQLSLLILIITVWILALWLVNELKKTNHQIDSLKSFGQRIDKYRSLGLLASGVCHGLGTPLNTTLMKLNRMRNELAHTPLEDDFEVALRNLDQCADTLKKLNTRVHDADEHFYQEKIEIVETLKEVISKYKEDSKLEIDFISRLDGPVFVAFPSLLFVRSLMDIFDNCQQANATEVSISIMRTHTNDIELVIRDDGDGFSNEVLKNLGSPFVTSKEYGSGLGLYQLSNTISYIGGSVSFENSHKGANVKLVLPIKEV